MIFTVKLLQATTSWPKSMRLIGAEVITKVSPCYGKWYEPTTCLENAKPHIRILLDQGARELSDSETCLVVQQDPTCNQHADLKLPQDVAPVLFFAFRTLSEWLHRHTGHSQTVRLPARLAAYNWPNYLLFRQWDSEAPTRSAKAPRVHSVKVLTTLFKRTAFITLPSSSIMPSPMCNSAHHTR